MLMGLDVVDRYPEARLALRSCKLKISSNLFFGIVAQTIFSEYLYTNAENYHCHAVCQQKESNVVSSLAWNFGRVHFPNYSVTSCGY